MLWKRSWVEVPLALLREHAESLILVIILALLVRWTVVSSYIVKSDALNPNYLKGDVVLGLKPPFGLNLFGEIDLLKGRTPRRGELVTYSCPESNQLCLKRVVAIPGDRVEMVKQRLIVNGEVCKYRSLGEGRRLSELSESCSEKEWGIEVDPAWEEESWGPLILEPGQIWVLNDKRIDRDDSRTQGPIRIESLEALVIGTLVSLDWSASNLLDLVRWSRSFSSVN